MNRNGELLLVNEAGHEREKYPIIYGAKLKVVDGQKVTEGQTLAEWDPYTTPILSEVSGKVKFGDIVEGETMQERIDEVTGLTYKVIIEARNPELRPRISIKDEKGRTIMIPGTQSPARYILPIGAHIVVNEGDEIFAGDTVSKMPRETTKTKDITGGLPRVAELFEARRPKESATVTEISGLVSFGKLSKGKREIVVTPERGETRKYLIQRGKHVIVHEGDYVRAGEALIDGPVNPHDVLRILGTKDLARYLVDEIQEVYQLQGVKINDKHIEIIVRQMLKRVRINEVGDTNFIIDEPVEWWVFEEENRRVMEKGGTPATAESLFLGITKASLITDSFISAASFQDTTKVLTQAAIEGRVDYLRGLKENVIMGRIIPAGTGFSKYRNYEMVALDKTEEPPRRRRSYWKAPLRSALSASRASSVFGKSSMTLFRSVVELFLSPMAAKASACLYMALAALSLCREPVDYLLKLDYRFLIGLQVHIALAHPVIGIGGQRRGRVLLHELGKQGHGIFVCPLLKSIETLFIYVFRVGRRPAASGRGLLPDSLLQLPELPLHVFPVGAELRVQLVQPAEDRLDLLIPVLARDRQV